jgi:stage V sporulation protein G
MEITEVKVFPVDEEKLKAFVSIVFDRCFMVNDIKIIQGRDGLFISMPSRKKKNGEFKDVAHPLNNETRQMIEQVVVAEYERVLGERGEELPAPPRPFPADAAEATAPAAADGGGRQIDGRLPGGRAPVAEAPIAAAEAVEPVPPPGGDEAAKSLEEVQELHLRDSFWSVS